MNSNMKTNTLAQLRNLGFDLSSVVPFEKRWRVRCSQCAAVCINGIPAHELKCPNARAAREAEEED